MVKLILVGFGCWIFYRGWSWVRPVFWIPGFVKNQRQRVRASYRAGFFTGVIAMIAIAATNVGMVAWLLVGRG